MGPRDADPLSILVPGDAGKDARHRLSRYAEWLSGQARPWHKPALAAYRDHLLNTGHTPSTVSVHLSTIRARYADILRERDLFYALAAQQTADLVECKAIVDELIARIENAIDPRAAAVQLKSVQDQPDTEHVRLTSAQASTLMAAPGVDTLVGLRDTAVIALMLCTGIREAELSALDVPDLRQRLGGELALHVRKGKGRKERLIPYGELEWVLAILERWMAAAGIERAGVFRGFYKGNRRLRAGRLSVRAIQYLLASYPVMVNGTLTTVKPHDLRRTYTRRLYEAGVEPVAIQQNLGHTDLKTTLGYIGELDATARRAPAVYEFDLGKLAAAPVPRAH
jgi:site-specific recombinase XerD